MAGCNCSSTPKSTSAVAKQGFFGCCKQTENSTTLDLSSPSKNNNHVAYNIDDQILRKSTRKSNRLN